MEYAFSSSEYERFKAAIPKKRHKALFELSTITGMKYSEIQRLYNHPEWYSENRNQIRLNEEAQKKTKRKAKERTIDLLPSTLPYILDQFLNEPAPPELIPGIRTLKDGQLKLNSIHLGYQLKPQEKALNHGC